MIVYFELHCIRKDRTEHDICNIQIKKDDIIATSGRHYDIVSLKDVSGYEYDFSILIDLNIGNTTNNKYLDKKIKEVEKIVSRKNKIKKILNGKI